MEPNEYFSTVKNSIEETTDQGLNAVLDTLNSKIVEAHKIGQTALLSQMVWSRSVVEREQKLFVNGFKRFVTRKSAMEFIEKVTPKNSVKMIELSRFPRIIPEGNIKDIQKAQELDLFDAFYIIFTDFTDNRYESAAEKAVINRNRDPIVLGVFRNVEEELRHDRMYFITDWEDEYCDLTFDKMIDKMAKLKIDVKNTTISQDDAYLNAIIMEVQQSNDKKKLVEQMHETTKHSKWENIKNFFKGSFP